MFIYTFHPELLAFCIEEKYFLRGSLKQAMKEARKYSLFDPL
jgi:hypothetical protein